MRTSFNAALAVAALGLAGIFTAGDASASSWVTYEFTYPGTQCNSFGAAGMGANGGAELVNWSNPGSVLVECPFLRDSTTSTIDNTIYLDYSSNVSCDKVYSYAPGQGTWAFRPTSTTYQNGYNTYNWNANYGVGIGGAAIQCNVSQLGTIVDYRVNTYFQENPGR